MPGNVVRLNSAHKEGANPAQYGASNTIGVVQPMEENVVIDRFKCSIEVEQCHGRDVTHIHCIKFQMPSLTWPSLWNNIHGMPTAVALVVGAALDRKLANDKRDVLRALT